MKDKKINPIWCNYPSEGKYSKIVDMCWKVLKENNIKKQDCGSCEFCNKEEKV